MRTSATLVAVLTALLLATAGAGVASAGAGYAACSGGFGPDGSPGSFYRRIVAKRVACSAARPVVRAWVVHESQTDGANPTKAIRVKGFTCRGRGYGGSGDEDGGLAVTCKHGSRQVVRFIGHP